MKHRASPRPKPDAKSAPSVSAAPNSGPIDSAPSISSRRLQELGKDIAGLRSALDKLAAENASERRRK